MGYTAVRDKIDLETLQEACGWLSKEVGENGKDWKYSGLRKGSFRREEDCVYFALTWCV